MNLLYIKGFSFLTQGNEDTYDYSFSVIFLFLLQPQHDGESQTQVNENETPLVRVELSSLVSLNLVCGFKFCYACINVAYS